MKKIYASIIMLLLTVTSCSDYLDVRSPSAFDDEYVFGSESEIATAVNGMYVPMVSGKGWVGVLAKKMLFNTDVEFSTASNSSNLKEAAFVPSAGDISSYDDIWEGMYDGVNRTNDVIEGIEKSLLFQTLDKTKPSRLMHYYGEAKVLRAMYYLELVRNWGDVPYRREQAGNKDELFIGATDRDTILAHMINDLIEVEPYMLYAESSDRGAEAASREFCQAMIARMALYRGGWSLRPNLDDPTDVGTMRRPDDWRTYYRIAETYTGKVISEGKHSLKRSFKQVWVDEANWIVPTDDDNIFDVPAKVGGSGEIGYSLGTQIVSARNSDGQTASNASQGYASGGDRLAITYMLSFDDKDLRRDITCQPYRYENSGASDIEQKAIAAFNMTCGKFNRLYMLNPLGQTSNKGTGINWPYMRYADVLLMYAEAVNENNGGPNEDAKEALKTVRRRAFASSDWNEKVENYVNSLDSKEKFFEAIVNERAWELGGEKIRRFDLARWNLYGKTLYNLYFDWIKLGKISRTKELENTETPFEDPTYADEDFRFKDYPAVAYYKSIPAVDAPANCVSRTLSWYQDANGVNSYSKALDSYPVESPTGYTKYNMCNQYIEQVKNSNPRQWVVSPTVLHSFYGYINESNASTVNPETDPVRYLAPIPPDAISSHQGTLKNYYGY